MRAIIFAALAAILPVGAGFSAELNWQNHDAILTAMTAVVASDFRQRSEDFRATPLPLDARLRLSECGQALEAFLPPGRRLGGLTTVGVRCAGPRPWTIYGKVRVDAYREVLITDHPLRAGTLLSPADLRVERRSLADLPANYLGDASQALGQALRRPLASGVVLSSEQLAVPKLIRRGEKVTIRAETAGFEVRMTGEAMIDGEAGGRIRIRNDQSAKIIEGTVIGPGLVSVGL